MASYVDASWGWWYRTGMQKPHGLLVNYGDTVISATSCIQWSVVLSTSKAKNLELSDATGTIEWLRTIIAELNVEQQKTNVYQDNTGTIQLA